VGVLSAGELVDVAEAWHKVAAWVAERELAAVAALHAGERYPDAARIELSCALRLSSYATDVLIEQADTLATVLPGTRAALATGQISARHAAAVVEAVNLAGLEAEAIAVVEDKALRSAGRQNVAQLRRTLTRAITAADPGAAERRHRDRIATRQVRLSDAGDGMARYSAEIEAVAAAKLAATVTDHAHTLRAADKAATASNSSNSSGGAVEVRTLDAARADALCQLVAAGAAAIQASNGQPPTMTVETTIHITVPLTVLLGLDDSPAELSGHGPITAAQARAAAHTAGATWRRLITDDVSGTVLDVGRTRYRPPAAIADTVRAQHPRCLFPTCSHPSTHCDLDHREEYDRTGNGTGGATSVDNLGPLCRYHHNAKTHGGWAWTVQPSTGAVTWTSPTGHSYPNPDGPTT